MIKPNHGNNWGLGLIKPPAYPFTAQNLYADLHARLEAESGEKISFERLGQIIGRSKSTAHHWFGVSSQQLVIAWLCLLERLSGRARLDFLEAHCRIFPTLEHRRFVHAPSKTGKMLELVRQKTGLTFVSGGSDAGRTFVVTAMGHS